MMKFRKRFNAKRLAEINEKILQAEKAEQEQDSEEKQDNDHHGDGPNGSNGVEEVKSELTAEKPATEPAAQTNQGRLIIDATCTPADISF